MDAEWRVLFFEGEGTKKFAGMTHRCHLELNIFKKLYYFIFIDENLYAYQGNRIIP